MQPLVWYGDEKPRSSTAEDLRSVVSCWTRVEILLALSGPRRNLAALSKLLQKSSSLLDNHLLLLRQAGLVRRARQGLSHFHILSQAARVEWLPKGVRVVLSADDGTIVEWTIPYTAAVMRIMSGGLAAAGHPLSLHQKAPALPDSKPDPPGVQVPARRPGVRNAGRPPSARG